MSALPQDDTRVACLSCRYRYASVRGFCPICGAPAPSFKVLQGLHEVTPTNHPSARGKPSQRLLARPSRKSFTILFGLTLVVCTWVFARLGAHKEVLPNHPPSPATNSGAARSSESLSPDQDAPSRVVPASEHVRLAASSARPSSVSDDSPTGLWHRVRHGDSAAEVSLARLYVHGTGVPQNCEQARLLLDAAAKRHYSAPKDVVAEYGQLCH